METNTTEQAVELLVNELSSFDRDDHHDPYVNPDDHLSDEEFEKKHGTVALISRRASRHLQAAVLKSLLGPGPYEACLKSAEPLSLAGFKI